MDSRIPLSHILVTLIKIEEREMKVKYPVRTRSYFLFMLISILIFLSCSDSVQEPQNNPPLILDIFIVFLNANDPPIIGNGTTVFFSSNAIDADGDDLIYSWEMPVGTFPNGPAERNVRWVSPETGSGTSTLKVTVSDGIAIVEKTKEIDWGQ